MSAAPVLALGDVADVIRGITFKPTDVVPPGEPGSIVCFRTKNVQEEIDLSDLWAVPDSFVKRADQRLAEGDLLVSTANSWNLVGKCCWVPKLEWDATLGGFISAIRVDRAQVDPRYLYRWLSLPSVQAQVRNCARQTTNIANLSIERCLALQLPVPPLPEQRRIAAILDQTDALRRLRRQSLIRLDELGAAIFVDMFGDPITNSRALDTRKLGSMGKLDRGRSKHRPRNDPALLGGPYPLIQTGEVARASDFIRGYTATYSELGLRQSKMWKKGTLCITIAANIADTAILDFDACFPDSVVGFDAGSDDINFFVHGWLKLTRGELERVAPAVAQKNINLAILRDLNIISPSDEDIRTYYRRMQGVLRQHRTLEEHKGMADKAFANLQHRAYRGEL